MGRPKLYDDALRDRLLARAAALVFEHGAAALNLRAVAAGADTSTSAVYSLFGNKAGLMTSLYREAARRFAARLAEVDRSADPLDDIVRLGVAYRDYAVGEPHLYAIMFGPKGDEDERTKAEAASTIEPLVAAIRRAQDDGLLQDVGPERIALACWAVAHGLVSLELAGTVPPVLDVPRDYESALRAMVKGWQVTHSGE